jgi:predicted ATPase/class 3 adenylate cyclase/Tfp pilus assembly protein PilF
MMGLVQKALPSGTVTFVFTDVEGSTGLLSRLGTAAYAEALADHRRMLREAFASFDGVEVDSQGDALFFAFPTAPGALEASRKGQQALEPGAIRVRIGIHTGTPLLTKEGYVGIDVHRAARIAAAGHGGQVLVSATTASLVAADSGLPLVDLGSHRLKDLSAPERIFQLGQQAFPALKSLHRTNLPIPATPFLGRERELAEVVGLLPETRLLTLTGPGGTGKTRLGLQTVASAAEDYPAGVFWVSLAPLRDAELVLDAAARVLDARGDLAEHIGDRSLLLLFDNFEHVIEAAPGLGELLAACPRLKLVVTSRELLWLPGEQAYPVPPLEPADGAELFLARARSARPDFTPSVAVTELCTRLDNLPLALELAAARVRVLSPAQLLERLSQRLDLLKAGRGVDPRQQTLRATIEWSYDLLTESEQQLFARLAVFYGTWSLQAAEAICAAEIDTLQSLVDKSLVRPGDGERFWMLETIREYAAELLEHSDEGEELRRRRAEYFVGLAERIEPELDGDRQGEWLERLEQDLPNLRAVLEWSTEVGDEDLGLRLSSSVATWWFKRGHIREGRRWLAEFVDEPNADATARAKALVGLAVLATMNADWSEAERRADEGLKLSEQLGEPNLGAWALLARGRTLIAAGDHERARALFREAEALGMKDDSVETVAVARFNLGYDSLSSGDYDEARHWFQTTLEGLPDAGRGYWAARTLAALGSVSLHQGRTEDAIELLRRSLGVSSGIGDRDNMAWAVELLGVAYAGARIPAAARLLGAAEALRDGLGNTLEGVELALHERAVAELEHTSSPEELAAAWAAGRALSPDLIVEEALVVHPRGGHP